jgi:hypothetical protein
MNYDDLIKMYSDRMNTCRECEHFIKLTKQCGKCMCFMPVKVRMVNQHCPINKW